MANSFKKLQSVGNDVVDLFHNIALFVIGGTVIWSAGFDYLQLIEKGYADLKDILLLFIYLELGAMVGIYFKTHRLPVQYLIYITITALARHLVIDVQKVSDSFHLYLLLAISVSIFILSIAILILSYTGKHFGRPEDDIQKGQE